MKKYENITINELNIMYLSSKYNRITLRAYGVLQDKAKVVDDYLGNIKVKDIDSKTINIFKNYLYYERNWKYTTGNKISDTQIQNILTYLNYILQMAVYLKIIEVNPMKTKVIHKEDISTHRREYIKEKHKRSIKKEIKRSLDIVGDLLK